MRDRIDFGRVDVVERALKASSAEIGAALVRRYQWHERMRTLMERYDVLLTPTMPLPAFKAGLDHPGTVGAGPCTGSPGRRSPTR